jgi:HlyD family secretion protein
VVIGLVVIWLKVVRGSENPTSNLATFTAKRGPLTISVLESGTIKAREQIIIKNEVEGRTSIITLIPEGTRVKKGDLLVELDASNLEDNRIDQEIRVQNTEASYVNATENLAVVQNQAESDIDKAKLTLDFAKQDLQQYIDGRYPNEKKSAEAQITLAQEELTRAEETLNWSSTLYSEKYISKTQMQADELAFKRAELSLELRKSDLQLLEEFTYHRNIAQLESDVRQAEMALERTTRKAKANVVQARAELNAKEQEYNRQKDKLAKLEDQIKKAKVYAPTDGMVIYATSAERGGFRRESRQPLDEGVEVFERQELIYLPTATSAMAEVDIHEASLEKVRNGLPAVVTVDALPGKKFFGTVARIAPLPDPQSMWMNPDLKVYNSDIYLEGNEPSLRTGMSCKAEIIVEQYEDVVYIPVQGVLRVTGQPTVYVVNGKSVQPRSVEIGLDNNRMVKIISGLKEGEIVLLTPPLKAGAVVTASEGAGLGSEPSGVAETLRERVNERLEEVNGAARISPSGTSADQQTQWPSSTAEPGREDRGPQQGQQSEEISPPGASSEQLEKNMSPEERQRMRERFQGGPPGEGQRSRQRGQERNQ